MKKITKRKNKIKEKCSVCKNKKAEYECLCGVKLCEECHTEYEGECPKDDFIEHYVEKIN